MFDLTFNVDDKGMLTPLTLAVDQAVIAGWTGRDPVARDKHIAELEAIGIARPVSVLVETFGTGKIPDEKIAKLVEKHFDLRPKGIIHSLNLLRPIYGKTAAYGHFGRDEPEFSWEAIDKVSALKDEAGIK